jgi:hypothetical protein
MHAWDLAGISDISQVLMAHTHTSRVCNPETTYCPFDPRVSMSSIIFFSSSKNNSARYY